MEDTSLLNFDTVLQRQQWIPSSADSRFADAPGTLASSESASIWKVPRVSLWDDKRKTTVKKTDVPITFSSGNCWIVLPCFKEHLRGSKTSQNGLVLKDLLWCWGRNSVGEQSLTSHLSCSFPLAFREKSYHSQWKHQGFFCLIDKKPATIMCHTV